MNQENYQAFTDRLRAGLEQDARVLGLVVAGSTANKSHAPDEWSDHDFFVVTVQGVQEDFRQDLRWLPDSEQIALSVRETEHGLKVLYDYGHVLEFAIFDMAEVARAKANDYAVLLDRGGLGEMMLRIAVPHDVPQPHDDRRDLGMVISLLLVGAGRFARGEGLSAHVFIKTYALGHLLGLLSRHTEADKSQLDNLDPYRRFEKTFPDLGAELNTILLLNPADAALALLALYERRLAHLPDFPARALPVVREYLVRVKTHMSLRPQG